MKKTFALLLLGLSLFYLCPLLAQAQAGSEKRITISFHEAKLSSALKQLDEAFGGIYKIMFVYDEVDSHKVTVDIRNALPLDALSQVLKNTPFVYTVKDRFISVSLRQKSSEQKRALTGTVTDEQGEPLIGAGILIVGEKTGTVTNVDGVFKLQVPMDCKTLQVSYIGMATQLVDVVGKNTVQVRMKEDGMVLDNVVVTGYQTLSKERSAGSFDMVKGDVISDKVALTGNILQGMEGLVTGLSVNMSDGADKYTVRGITSLNSTRSPLFVVDGVPLEGEQVESLLSGNDIESMTLLKDATAASIWGSQAANGVVVITTKGGSRKQDLRIAYDGSFTWMGKPDYDYLDRMDGETFLRNAQEMFDQYAPLYPYADVQTSLVGIPSRNNPVVFPHERLMYQALNCEISEAERDAALQQLMRQNGRKDYENHFLSNKLMTRHNVSFSGGMDKMSYYLSLGYVGDQGTEKDWANRFTVITKEEFFLAPWLKWDITLNASYGRKRAHLSPWEDYENDNILFGFSPYHDIPYATLYDSLGNPVDWSVYYISQEKRDEIEELTGTDMSFYPVDDFNANSSKTLETNLRLNTGLTIDLIKGLRYEARFQYSRFHSKTENYYPGSTWKIREERLTATPQNTLECALPTTGGNFLLDNSLTTDWTLRNQLSYNNEFNDGLHQLSMLVGTEIREYKNTVFSNFLRGYDMQSMQYTPYDDYNLNRISNPVYGNTTVSFNKTYYTQTEAMRRYFSLYGNLAYTFNNKYTLNASLRVDQSNLFGSNPDNQYKPIWSVGGAWKVSDETFMEGIDWLDRLTLRATFGFAGNSPLPGQGGNYDILMATSSSFYETNGFKISTPANDEITWEKTRMWNIGFDIDVLKSRLALTFDYYDKRTTDLISTMLLNPVSGWNSTIGNVGTLTNKGFELSLSSHNINGRDFNWYTNFTLSHNKNKITKLDVATPYTAETLIAYGSSMNVEGYPVNSLFAYRYAGLNEKGEPQAFLGDGTIVSGIDSRGLSREDAVYCGTTVPKFYGGLTNRFTYKDWELSFMFVYNFGNKMRNECEQLEWGRPVSNLDNSFDRRWRVPSDELKTDIPAWTPQVNSNANFDLFYYSDYNVLNASYIKLRDLSLAYRVPADFCKKLRLDALRVQLSIGNLFYWAANGEGIDPEYYRPDTCVDSRQERLGPSYSINFNINI